jgi:hypothetical protein
MITALYLLAILIVFNYLTETESQSLGASLSQRQLILILGAALVWPLVGLGLLYESRRELLDCLRTMLDIDVDMGQIMQDLNWHPEVEPPNTNYLDVDPDTL